MATKAELEAELAALRKQLAERPGASVASEPEAEAQAEGAETSEDDAENPIWDKEIAELVAEFDDFPHKKAVLLALGVFALGYLIGRSR